MLNTPSDYEFVNVSDVGSFIHGEVLPVRFSASSSSGKYATCNYEDYLYLLEAYYERMNWDQVGQNSISPANRTLSSSFVRPIHWTQAVGTFPGLDAGAFINPDSQVITSLTELSSSSFPSEVVSGYQMQLSSNGGYSYSPRSRSFRELELLGRFFWDYHRLKKLTINKTAVSYICSTNPTGAGTRRSYRADGSYTDSQTSYQGSGTEFYVYRHTNGTMSEEITQFTWQFKQPLITAPHATSATALLLFHLFANNPSLEKRYALPVQLQVQNGQVSFPSSNSWIENTIRTILNLNNLPYITEFQGYQQGIVDNTNIYMGNCFLFVDFDFPADYQAWSWQPTIV